MATGWQRQHASFVREANRLLPWEREVKKKQQAHDKKFKTRPLSRRFYCPCTYRDGLGNERICGSWDPEYVWWKGGEPYCDSHHTPLEIHPGMSPSEIKKGERAFTKR